MVACGPQPTPIVPTSLPSITPLVDATAVPTLALIPLTSATALQSIPTAVAVTESSQQRIDVREIPDVNRPIIRTVNGLSQFNIVGRSADTQWARIAFDDGVIGWVMVNSLPAQIIPNVAAAPVVDIAPELAAQATATSGPGIKAKVSAKSGGLRLRRLPDVNSYVLFNLPAGANLTVNGRTVDSGWALVKMSEGYIGWVSTGYLEMSVDLSSIPAIENPEPAPLVDIPVPTGAPQVASGVSGGARQIFLRGKSMGNRANVFTKVGDSLTDTPYFLRQFVSGYDLHEYGYLLPVLRYYSAATALDGISFGSTSRAAHASWSTFSVLDAANSDPGNCKPGEIPLECEYRTVKPAVALIMIGTNDAPAFPPETYEANMRRIVETSINMGVVPVLSTLPPRAEYNDKVIAYNQVILGLSRSYSVPLWDIYSAVVNLPNRGLNGDGVHLSIPPNAPAGTTDFTAENLKYGTTMRNLTALQMLDTVWKQVLY